MARNPRQLLIGAGVCAVLFTILLILAYGSGFIRWVDGGALEGFTSMRGPRFDSVTLRVAGLGGPLEVAMMGAALAAIALARGRPRVALGVVVLIAATSVSSQLLKGVLAFPRPLGDLGAAHVDPAAFPSGHSTAAMSLALAAVMVSPSRYRPLAALVGAGLALSVAFSVIALGWHFPSDAVGGFLLATGEALVIAAALAAYPGRRRVPERVERIVDRAAGIGLSAAALGGILLGGAFVISTAITRRTDLVDFARAHTLVLPVAAGLVLAALALLMGAGSLMSSRR
jgi:membrane-associated phospholipid phosphatase